MLHLRSGLTRSNHVTSMLRTVVLVCLIPMSLTVSFSGCEKKNGQAVVLAKEHIATALPVADTRNAESTASPNEQPRPMADDEIAVDGYVMKPEMRGTGRDPRALKGEQWLVKVRMLDDGRRIQVHADRAQWEKLRENDRVEVTYRIGKYTGTIWAAEID